MLKTRALFIRKNDYFEPKECVIEKVITLSGDKYDYFAKHTRHDYDFIKDNTDLMYYDSGNRTQHCLLVVGEGCEDGILIQSEGYEYARYSAFMPHAATILTAKKGGKALAELNNKMFGIVEEIVAKTLCCLPGKRFAVVDIGDLEREFGLDLEYNDALTDTIFGMLEERPEIRAVEINQNRFCVIPDPSYMTQREIDSPTEQKQDEPLLQAQDVSLNRNAELLDKALSVIGNLYERQALYDVLSDDLGMDDEEITAAGFELSDFFPITEEEKPAQIMSL